MQYRLNEKTISEILQRSEITPNIEKFQNYLIEKKLTRILITGCAGSLGSFLIKELAKLESVYIVGIDNNEDKLFHLFNDITNSKNIEFKILDINNKLLLYELFCKNSFDIVLHLAAYKHVGLSEFNELSSIYNNFIGTKNVVDLAKKFSVKKFLNFSSDKAVNPLCIMGKTKRMSEILTNIYSNKYNLQFGSVRLVNVIGSSNSIVPIILNKINAKQPINITDVEAKRYFMTCNEVYSLVIESICAKNHFNISILKNLFPYNIVKFVEIIVMNLTNKSLADYGSYITGLSKGEKLVEEIKYDFEVEVQMISNDFSFLNDKTIRNGKCYRKIRNFYDYSKIVKYKKNEIGMLFNE